MAASASLVNASLYKTPEGRVRVQNAYRTLLQQWPVPYEEIEVETRFGMTHVIASGDVAASPLILVHAFYATAMVCKANVAAFSRNYWFYS